MNIRKNIDYSEMYRALDILMAQQLPQTELYCKIGKAVCQRPEKGAAVMASEYLNEKYPDVKGFSPRSLRRMRDFYRTYENHPTLLSQALKLGWIQNVVIMEADLTIDLRKWYMKAAEQFGWSKKILTAKIAEQAHLEINPDASQETCDTNDIQGASHLYIILMNSLCLDTLLIEFPTLQQCRGSPTTKEVLSLLIDNTLREIKLQYLVIFNNILYNTFISLGHPRQRIKMSL